MEYCEYCERTFKTVQGLAGHHRMKHDASNGQYRAEYRPSAEQRQERLLEQFEERLLEEIQPQLERIERAALLIEQVKRIAVEDHRHGMSDPECPGCIELVSETLRAAEQKGVDKTVAYYEGIPGVTKLREMQEHNKANGKGPEQGITIVDDAGEPIPFHQVEQIICRVIRDAKQDADTNPLIPIKGLCDSEGRPVGVRRDQGLTRIRGLVDSEGRPVGV